MAEQEGDVRAKLPTDLLDVVFSWSLDDIYDSTLFLDELRVIPHTFKSVAEYSGSYIFPLLEEVRENLCASMETISDAPFSEISTILEGKCFLKNMYDVEVQGWKNKANGHEEDYRPCPGDIFIFSNTNPGTVSDLKRFGKSFFWASVTQVMEDGESPTSFRVKMSKTIVGYDGMGESLFAVFLINLITYGRVWKALGAGNIMKRDLGLIKDILCTSSLFQTGPCDFCNCDKEQDVDSACLSELNQSQADAVLQSIAELQCSHQSTVKLVWGPPGTGKTKIISELLWMSMSMNYRVLTCTPTNVSIREVSSRFLDLVKRRRGTVCRDGGCLLGDILLLGNNRQMKILYNDDLLDIFLDHRVDKLVECFAPLSGWRHRISSLLDFLKDYTLQYKMHIENERKEHDKDKTGGEDKEDDKSLTTLVEFFRKRFHALALPVKLCAENLCTHMPPLFLSENKINILIMLIDLLEDFETLLSKTSINDGDLESPLEIGECFAANEDAMMSVENAPNSIHITWRKCLDALRFLQDSLPVPSFFDKYRVREFCLGSSTIVFCTASTSFKMLKVRSFNLLVIDEAYQLKECESTIPLQLDGIQHVVLIGDECQLPATVKSKVSKEVGFGRSLFERLSMLGHPKHLLRMQYRMHPSISIFPNKTFYSSLILDGPNVTCKSYEKRFLPGKMYGPFTFINVEDGREELCEDGHSWRNVVEASVLLQIVHNLFKARVTQKEKISVGIISPYLAQVTLIERKIGKTYDIQGEFSVRVKSIDGFQGSEEDVIIISTVRSNYKGSIGFLADNRRANVALTRARHCLWVIGNNATLLKSGSVWEALIHEAESRYCLFNACEDKSLSKAIMKGIKEFDHLDDLLNKDSVMFRGAIWKVLFSDNFKKSFMQIKSKSTKMAVINFLLKLAEGWRPRKRTADVEGESGIELVRQYRVEGLYIIWTTDVMRYSVYTQVLKIWDIIPLSEIPPLVKRLENIFATYTDDYICHCKAKSMERKLEIPVTWNRTVGVIQYKHLNRNVSSDGVDDTPFDSVTYAENSKVSGSLILMKFYALSCGVVNHLLSKCDGEELNLPFEVTDEERDVILFPHSAFILGRSGTGKTTVLTTKLVQREQLYHISSEGLHESELYLPMPLSKIRRAEQADESGTSGILRQLFVTVSPKLCYAINSHICQMMSLICDGENQASTSSTNMYDIGDSIREFADVPDRFSNLNARHYPLIITYQKFLMMLDGSVGNSFFNRFHELKQLQLDERGYWRFPAFHAFMRHREVNYDRFASIYWPHFNNQLTKKLDPSIVFKEIISHIKGDLTDTKCEDVLSRDNYVSLSETRSSTLDSTIRGVIFNIFLDYERMKCAHEDFDISDFVIDIHKRIRATGGYVGDKIDFIYVDEVQDLTMRQIALFKYLSRNANESFIFAGDTAQTIARGIDFRFQDIRSLFYNEFLSSANDKTKQSSVCNLFHLRQNFRTHAGILKLGQSIIDLVYFFFPESIDRLSPENSLIYGEAPILLESKDEDAIVTIFGNCDGDGTNTYNGFGAEQVILVRDSISKEEILPLVGNQALVLTIVECKGLEFQDVLLCNFFGSSPLKHQWRVVYNYMESHNLLDPSTSYRCFDISRHNVLCSELKQLYVAITRTRQRLWICETKEEYAKPMFDYWKKLCLVQSRQLDDNLVQAMLVVSSKEEWRDRGTKLFREGNYEMATMCFERAGDVHREKWARAAGLRASGMQLVHTNYEMACSALTQAAEIYEAIGKADCAAECYIELSDYRKAGSLYLEKCGETRLEEAGDCFFQAGCWSLAAEVYGKVKNVSMCLSACSEGKLFDMGLNFIEYWKKDNFSPDGSARISVVQNSFLEKCAIYYHRLNDKVNMMRFVRGFTTIELIRDFLITNGYLDEMMLIEDEYGNYKEAAEVARQRGDLIFESTMFEKAGHYEQASKLILFFVSINSLWASGKTAWPPKNFPERRSLLEKAISLSQKVSNSFFQAVRMEADILAENTSSLENLLALLHCARTFENFKAEFFAIYMILDVQLQSESSKFDWQADPTMKNDISSCRPSITSLIHIWKLWKEKVEKMLVRFNTLVSGTVVDNTECDNFCLEYFGARKLNSKVIILNSEARWIRETNCKSYCKIGNLVHVEGHHFLQAAQRHWNSELFLMGINVQEKLEVLYKFSMSKAIPLLIQGYILLNSFLITKFLIDLNKSSGRKFRYREKMDFITEHFWESFFPLDWRKTLTKEMISLRESDAAKELTKEVIGSLTPASGNMTHGQIGRVAVLLFGIKNFGDKLDRLRCSSFSQGTPWHVFIALLQQSKDTGFKQVSVVSALHDALTYTFCLDWKKEKDYISPNCFIYLVERLLFLASCCQGFYYTTVSSFVEGMTYLSWNPLDGDCMLSDVDHTILVNSFELVASIVRQLLFHRLETAHWIRSSKLPISEYMHLLVPRLVIMLGLVILNNGRYFKLLEQLLGTPNVIQALPGHFSSCLKKARGDNFPNVFADALKMIQDPLVMVGKRKEHQERAPIFNALVINTDFTGGKEQMLDVLLPKPRKVDRGIDEGSLQSSSRSPVLAFPESHHTQDESLLIKPSNLSNRGENVSNLKICTQFSSTLEGWRSEYKKWKENGFFTSVTPEYKVEMHKFMQMLSEILGDLNQVVAQNDVEDLVIESKVMLDELKQLYDISNMSDEEREKKTATTEELLSCLCGRMPKLQPFLDSLMLQADLKGSEIKANGENPDQAPKQSASKSADDARNKPSQSKHQKKKAKKHKNRKK